MRPAFSSRTKRRGATALAPALRLFFVTASDMWHLYCDLTRTRSALDRDCAANTCHDIEWDDRRWNGCASSSLSCIAVVPLRIYHSYAKDILAPVMTGSQRVWTADMCHASPLTRSCSISVAPICWPRPCGEVRLWALLPAPNQRPQSRRLGTPKPTTHRSTADRIRYSLSVSILVECAGQLACHCSWHCAGQRGIERMNMQIGARPDKRRNSRAG